jgi:hypothetical protein
MKMNSMKAAPAASAIELKNEKSAKAKRILVGADIHLRGYQAARKIYSADHCQDGLADDLVSAPV